jgi:hypothetical protein
LNLSSDRLLNGDDDDDGDEYDDTSSKRQCVLVETCV